MKFRADFECAKVKRHAELFIDGKHVDIDDFCKIVNIKKKTILCAMDRSKSSEDFHIIIDNMLFKREHNLPHQTRIYRRGDEKYCVKFLRDITGVSEARAWQLIDDWEKGKRTLEEIQNIFPKEEDSEKYSTNHSKFDFEMGERKDINELKIGSWELEQLKKEKEEA